MNYRFSPAGVASSVLGGLLLLAYALARLDFLGVSGWWPPVLVAVFFVGSIAWWIWDVTVHGQHRRALDHFVEQTDGWQYSHSAPQYRNRFRAFPFGVGRYARDVDVIRGPFRGFSCASFTHQYEEGKKDEYSFPRAWQIDLVELPYPLSTVDILPDDELAKFAKLLGGQDIDFESAAFNARWRVKAGDVKYAHDIVHPRMMERLLVFDADGMAIRIEGSAVYAWAAERRGPEDLAARLSVLTAVARLIPEFVYREFKEVHERLAEAERVREENAPAWAKTPGALTSGRYTELGREEYKRLGLPEFEDEGTEPPRESGPATGRGRWDAPPQDPHRTGPA
jgi:hypothetical protein